MDEPHPTAEALPGGALTPGRRVEIWDEGVFCYHARVEEHIGRLAVVWVRETGLGDRRLVLTQQCRPPAPEAPAPADRQEPPHHRRTWHTGGRHPHP